MKPKKCRKTVNGIASIVIVLVFLSDIPALNGIRKEIMIGVTLLMIGDIVFAFIFLRCPHCKKLLSIKSSSQNICYHCGAKLEEKHF